jgi:hypothetical protein
MWQSGMGEIEYDRCKSRKRYRTARGAVGCSLARVFLLANDWVENRVYHERAPIEAGHPEGRSCAKADPRAEAHDGPYGPNELPFDPSCPPERPGKAEDGWLPEHMGAWFRAMVPGASAREVRQFVRTIWDIPRASVRAGWPRDPNAPPEECVFRGMSEEEIAAWLRKEVPDVTEYEAQDFAKSWIQRLEEAGRKESEAAGVAG